MDTGPRSQLVLDLDGRQKRDCGRCHGIHHGIWA